MRTLVIPDLHHRVENAEHWLESQNYSRVVFLGDYFDDFNDDPAVAMRTAEWLRWRIEQTHDVFLLGNHDAPYMFPENPQIDCPGYTQEKATAIRKILLPEHWRRFQIMNVEQCWLLSHAGFDPYWIKLVGLRGLRELCDSAMVHAAKGVADPLFGAGQHRQGLEIDGPLWLDWPDLMPVAGVNQVVGHTPGFKVRKKNTSDSRNYCLDVHKGKAAAIIENGNIHLLG
ncbi:MAG: metallophosphoesterase family protein [Verrucomicrobiota bacterium]